MGVGTFAYYVGRGLETRGKLGFARATPVSRTCDVPAASTETEALRIKGVPSSRRLRETFREGLA